MGTDCKTSRLTSKTSLAEATYLSLNIESSIWRKLAIFMRGRRAKIIFNLTSNKQDLFIVFRDFFEKPVIQQFIKEIQDLPSVGQKTIELEIFFNQCLNYYDHLLLIKTSKNQFIEEEISNYLTAHGAASIKHYAFWQIDNDGQNTLNLIIEKCIQIKWNITDMRILYSDLLIQLYHPLNKSTQIWTAGSIFPITFSRDISFWYRCDTNSFDFEKVFQKIWSIFGPSLKSIMLLEKYTKIPNKLWSYCYRLHIQSIDRAINKSLIDHLLSRLKCELESSYDSIKVR